jgi:hypothetical protein
MRFAYKVFYRVGRWRQTRFRGSFVKELTFWLFGAAPIRDVGADELKELLLGDLEVFGELFGGQAAGHGLFEGVALLLQQFEGVAVVLFKGAGPGLV